MQTEFWLGLIIGGVLSFLGSVLANFFGVPIGTYVARRKVSWVESNRKRALRNYRWIRDLHSGKKDKYLAYLVDMATAILSTICIASAILLLLPAAPRSTWWDVAGACTIFLFALRHGIYLNIMRTRLDRFDDYKKTIMNRWGDVD
jgi:hypothetical protein